MLTRFPACLVCLRQVCLPYGLLCTGTNVSKGKRFASQLLANRIRCNLHDMYPHLQYRHLPWLDYLFDVIHLFSLQLFPYSINSQHHKDRNFACMRPNAHSGNHVSRFLLPLQWLRRKAVDFSLRQRKLLRALATLVLSTSSKSYIPVRTVEQCKGRKFYLYQGWCIAQEQWAKNSFGKCQVSKYIIPWIHCTELVAH